MSQDLYSFIYSSGVFWYLGFLGTLGSLVRVSDSIGVLGFSSISVVSSSEDFSSFFSDLMGRGFLVSTQLLIPVTSQYISNIFMYSTNLPSVLYGKSLSVGL